MDTGVTLKIVTIYKENIIILITVLELLFKMLHYSKPQEGNWVFDLSNLITMQTSATINKQHIITSKISYANKFCIWLHNFSVGYIYLFRITKIYSQSLKIKNDFEFGLNVGCI